MRFLQRLFRPRGGYFLPPEEFQQHLKDALRQQESGSRWINVACLDLQVLQDDLSRFDIEKTLKMYSRTVMTRLEPGRYILLCAMFPDDAERHISKVQRELQSSSDLHVSVAGFNVALMSFDCFIPILEFDQKMDVLLAELSHLGQNVLLHEIVGQGQTTFRRPKRVALG
jgi:hypothetical protein